MGRHCVRFLDVDRYPVLEFAPRERQVRNSSWRHFVRPIPGDHEPRDRIFGLWISGDADEQRGRARVAEDQMDVRRTVADGNGTQVSAFFQRDEHGPFGRREDHGRPGPITSGQVGQLDRTSRTTVRRYYQVPFEPFDARGRRRSEQSPQRQRFSPAKTDDSKV